MLDVLANQIMSYRIYFCFLFPLSFPFLFSCTPPSPQESPYPQSPVIESVTWHTDTHVAGALGSDLWPNAWAADDNVYVAWGDGGGFGGTNSDGRVSLGYARIEREATNFTAINVNGGMNSAFPPTWDCDDCGKTAGILSVDGTIYALINLQNGKWPNVDFTLAWSDDLTATWQQASWMFPRGDGNFKPSTFLNAGKDYAGARDDFVYFYGTQQGEDTNSYMGRVPKDRLKDRTSYEFFTGLNSDGSATWTSDVAQIQPVFSDPNGTSGGHVVYSPAIKRYILTNHRGRGGEVGIFDAPDPWGPWTTVAYYDNWIGANGGRGDHGLVYAFVNKWTSSDGLIMWMIFSCYNCASKYHDRFNLIKATLTLKTPTRTEPSDKN